MTGSTPAIHLPLRIDVRLAQLRVAFLLRTLIQVPAQTETPRYCDA